MKKIFCLVLSILTVFSLVACSSAGSGEGATQEASGLQAGYGRVSIMPDGEVHLGGGDASKRISTTIMDNLYITCIALKENDQTYLIYTIDLITADDSVVDPVKSLISGTTGVPQENILMNTTHCHSSVSLNTKWDGVENYRIIFNNAATAAATTAIADLAPVTVSYGEAATQGLAFVRHYELSDGSFAGSNFGDFAKGEIVGHSTEADNVVQVVQFAREGKKNIVMMNFPAHATMNGATTDTMISADFPGTARQHVENNADVQVAYFIAAAGDQVPTTKIKGEAVADEYKAYGKALGQYVLDLLPNLTPAEGTGVKLSTKTYTANSNKVGLEKLPYADAVIEAGKTYGNTSAQAVAAAREHGFSSYFEASAVKSRASLPATLSMELKAMTVGNIGFVFAPYEMFGTQAIDIRAKSPMASTFIITCGEGAQGYLPSQKGIEIGCYEACVTRYEYGTAEKLADEFVAMLAALKG